ncbi:hypothetical protein [Alkalihalobacillus trypoxylicola]|uniref:Uncharacterized protein n=1 Tax=Alkalihalobacillus trypoxylicola TaxID=519424 RepID=A0A162DD51_9BACI|nr:hypothetical protein [Alkalihalobacillus trypoxylicola]KYG29245.1 hypothetical protein AZF04_06890 [Alkalihalobacillus trypoxylicola]
MKLQKIIVAFISSIILVLFLPVIFPILEKTSYFQNVIFYAIFLTPVIFIYGILTSLLSDFLAVKYSRNYERTASFFFHILFGIAFILPYSMIFDSSIFDEGLFNFATIAGPLCAIIFFGINELVLKVKWPIFNVRY